MLKVSYDPIYKYELPEGHRFPMEKYDLLPQQLLYEGTLNECNFFAPSRLDSESILLTHTKEYLDKLDANALSRKEARTIGFPIRPELIERGRYIAGGTFNSVAYARKYGISMNIAGGTHHSFADHGEGFCLYNDIAIASNMVLRDNPNHKILVVDLDVHQGNGTAKIFENESRVFTFSMHGAKNYPVRKMQSDLDVPMPDGCRDIEYLEALRRSLDQILNNFQPDLVFYLSGVDVLETDKLGRLALSKEGCRDRDEYVFKMMKSIDVPVVVSMGGGYSERIADIIDAHANTYRMAQDVYF